MYCSILNNVFFDIKKCIFRYLKSVCVDIRECIVRYYKAYCSILKHVLFDNSQICKHKYTYIYIYGSPPFQELPFKARTQ